jgi:hypothetical protein
MYRGVDIAAAQKAPTPGLPIVAPGIDTNRTNAGNNQHGFKVESLPCEILHLPVSD